MAMGQMKERPERYEQLVPAIMRRLPSHRLVELVDFAQFLDIQSAQQQENLAEMTTEDAWDHVLTKPAAKRLLREMAAEAREDDQAGRTTEIHRSEIMMNMSDY